MEEQMLLPVCLDERKRGTSLNPLLQMSSRIFDYVARRAIDFHGHFLTSLLSGLFLWNFATVDQDYSGLTWEQQNKALTFSHQVHGSGSSLAYLQYRRGTPVNHRGIGTVPSALMILRSSGDHF
ncbi:hypothetical protein CDAR_379951 [Caerostris darwini]|uniref:Uncharacterized protein n=1 Tax=Caerostris darwini TaxID=1538125 RepID=A0AAV4MLJ9_9ARAC|nr:hypothetical protein CDAR_379951 [Caerostris darwini]